METSRIGIFESISLLSKLMPYYGSSHEGFLLLSLLSKIIRDNLLEHYPEYRAFMLKHAKVMNGMRYELLEMKLPFDLFQFPKLDVYYEEDAELFVVLIPDKELLILYCKLTNKEGLYFGEHYMSDQICIEKIYVQPKYIENLIKHYIEFKIKFK